MSSMLFLALLIVLVSGLIAYVGDLIGRKMGRKRLTLLGLRPRHTAIVISVSMGMFIAALTLVATFAVSASIREIFYTPISIVRDKLAQLKSEQEHTEAKLRVTEAKLLSAQDRATEMTIELGTMGDKLRVSEHRLIHSTNQRRHALAELASIQQRLQKNQQQLTAVQRQLTTVRIDLAQSKTQFDKSSQKLISSTRTLQKLQDEQLRLEDEKKQLQDSLGEFLATNFTPLAFVSGQEILSGLVPAEGSTSALRGWLKKFLAAAERVVRRQSRGLPTGAAEIIFLRQDGGRLVRLSPDDAIEMLCDRITRLYENSNLIIRFVALNNVPVNGPAMVSVDAIEMLPNTLVFTAGAEVARVEMSITAQTTTAEVVSRLVDDLLSARVPAALRAKEAVMVLRRYDPRHPDMTPEAALSQVPWSELLVAAEQARTMTGKVSLIARSRTKMYRYSPPDLALEAAPVNSP